MLHIKSKQNNKNLLTNYWSGGVIHKQ